MKWSKFFIFLMVFLSLLTFAKYLKISNIKSNSQEFTFIIEGNAQDISSLKSDIQGMTYQPVIEEVIEEGKYRLKIKCPPDKIGLIKLLFLKLEKTDE